MKTCPHCLSKPKISFDQWSLATTMIMALSLRIIITAFLLLTTTASSSSPHGFTVDLIHRRSNTSSLRLYSDDGGSPYANTVYDYTSSEYLMKIQIGTPPVEIEAMIDTGSPLIWTQCLPCHNCYNQADPIFDPSKSSTYKPRRCDTPDHSCPYELVYAGKSYTKGTFASETVTIQSTSGQPFVMPGTIIGCGHNNSGLVSTTSGIVGLNWGSTSLTSQMGETFLGLLSYCFSGTGTSKINFGSNAIVAGDGTVAADMFRKTDKPDFYYLNLDAISVGDNRVETLGTSFYATDGNIVIDSGTTYTFLPGSYLEQVMAAVESVVTADRAASSDMLCYYSNTVDIFPAITMHFSGGADLVLDKYNTYVNKGGIFCLALMDADPIQLAVFGNRAQNNFLVGYDPSSTLVSFKPTDCSALF